MFDKIIITAANEAQARGYRAQTKNDQRVSVIADPGGKRVGSLGATVNALRKIANSSSHSLSGARVLICHSGGDARRTPGYAAMGKAFVPMQDGRSMFLHIVETMERLAMPPGVLVVSGDVLPTFPYQQAEFGPGVTGVAYFDGPFEAQRHGVYIVDQKVQSGLAPVRDFLQKPQVTGGKWLIDTGIMFIDWPTAEKMKHLPIAGDIYEEFPKLLLAGFAPFSVNVMKQCEFFHIGSSRELLAKLGHGTYIDAVNCELELAGGNIVTNVPVGRFTKLRLGKDECFTCLPIGKHEWYDLRYRLEDNFKTDGLWEKHGMAEKMKRLDYSRLLEVRRPVISVRHPLRIDLAGGWSDTPPICNEVGGCVLNVAVELEGKLPVMAEVQRIAAKEVRVESVDLGKRGVLTKRSEIYGRKDPRDWCALVKSALAVTGYEFSQGGLAIRIAADVPKGSGLGTSSILGATLLQALLEQANGKAEKCSQAKLVELTLKLEQEMETGGGWQDQIGGLCDGVKLIRSRPGATQKLTVCPLPEPAAQRFAQYLQERGVLYFTGQKRMARNVLRGVVDFYRDNPEGIAKAIVKELKKEALASFKALKSGDFPDFERALNAYWMQKKALDPGSTNPAVESIIARITPWTAAVTLCGAGGGGFLFAIAKSKAARARMQRVLKTAGNGGRCYDFRVVL